MSRVAGLAARAIDVFAIAAFAGMFACVLAQVVFRYFLGDPLTWSDELGRYLFVWCAFLGWVVAARRRSHLTVSMFSASMSPRMQGVFALVGAFAAIVFAAVLAWHGTRLMARNLDVETASLAMSMGIVYAIVPAAAIAVALHAFVDAIRAMRVITGRAPS